MAIVVLECPHCSAEKMTFQHLATSNFPKQHTTEFLNYLHLQCRGCGNPVAIEVSNGSGGAMSDFTGSSATLEQLGYWVVESWPRAQQPAVPSNLPDQAMRAYLAAERNFPHDGMEEAAAGSYGRALDVGTKLFAPDLAGLTLFNRIKKLAEQHRITGDLATWAHAIRLVRNDALHSVDSIERDELIAIRGFSEMVLTYLFTLPGMLAARQAQTSVRPTP